MNKTKLLSIAVIGLLVLNVAILTFLFLKPGDNHHGPGEGPKQLIIERLGFDEVQQKQYSIIVDEHRSKMKELNKTSRQMHDNLYSQLKNTAIDKAQADSIIQKIAENQTALDNLNFDHFQKIKAICKNDQLDEFNALVDDLTELFAPHHNGRPPKNN